MAPFWVFLALTPSNIVQSCWNFDQRMSPMRQTQTVFEKSFKILNFGPNGMHPEFTVYCYKTKNTAKNQNFCNKKKHPELYQIM